MNEEIVWIVKRSDYRIDKIEKVFSDREEAETYVRDTYSNAVLSTEEDRERIYDIGSMKSVHIKGFEVED